MFFTIIALILVSIMIVVFSRNIGVVREDNSPAVRIKSIDKFLSEVELSYMPLAARAAAVKALQASVIQMNKTGQFFTQPEVELGGVMLNGTFGSQVAMANNTLENFSAQIEKVASEVYAISLDIRLHEAKMSQINHWQVNLVINFSYVAKADVGNWTRQGIIISTSIPVEGLTDPQYMVRTQGAYLQKIKMSAVTQGQWNISTLNAFISAGEYTRFGGSDAPSYLERFKSSPASSECCGIESTINPAKISPSSQQESYADYQFFASSEECSDLYSISGGGFSHANFKLDFDHLIQYNVSQYASALSCTP